MDPILYWLMRAAASCTVCVSFTVTTLDDIMLRRCCIKNYILHKVECINLQILSESFLLVRRTGQFILIPCKRKHLSHFIISNTKNVTINFLDYFLEDRLNYIPGGMILEQQNTVLSIEQFNDLLKK